MALSDQAREDNKWWIANLRGSENRISRGTPDKVIFTDALNSGFGYSDGNRGDGGVLV